MSSFAFEGLRPVIDPAAYVYPSAVLIGDVIVGASCYVGPLSVAARRFRPTVLKPGSNIQHNCTMHSFPGREGVIEESGHVGHGAVLHDRAERADRHERR